MKANITSIVMAGALLCGTNAFADGPHGSTRWNHDAGGRADVHGDGSRDRGFHDVDYRGHEFHHDHPHTYFSFSIGAPLFWRPYAYYPYYGFGYPYPYYDYPRTVVIQRQPEVYVQQQPAPAANPQPGSSDYWYYCPDSKTYYPYVQTCPSNWMTVVPSTSAPNQ